MNTPDEPLATIPMMEPEGGVFEAYANIVNLNWTLTDVRLRFAELIHVLGEKSSLWEDQEKVMMERAAITLPWHQAKMLAQMLVDLVGQYEAVNGELRPLNLAARPGTPAPSDNPPQPAS